ncbi:fibrous sheath-interacting protein 1 isoform X1 [Nerophis lumbriciformis]|uniref:fibrous sheath-interacting protein 1 isoform X1 n=2 Tax=Nerophis lumbriciformis TaxID=546530 RepID=UPI003BAD3818
MTSFVAKSLDVDCTIMEMVTGVSENTSTPASSESSGSIDKGLFNINATDEEKQDPELQQAIEEMRRLDETLSACMCRLKEAKRQRKELQEQLWQELKDSLEEEGCSESSQEAKNARLFMALEAPIGPPEREDFFKTQLFDCDLDRRLQRMLESDDWTQASESVCEETDEGSHDEGSMAEKKQKDFVKRNIELARGKGGQVLLTQAEEERLAELLQDLDEEEEESASGADNKEDMWAVPVSTNQGYTQGTSDLERLTAIDCELSIFQPVVDVPLLQSSSHAHLNKERGSDIGPKRDCDAQPGEKVLQDIKEMRTQEMQLQEIQRQLDLLGQGQEMTSESEALSEQQLLSLLDACELTEPGP